MSEPNASEIQLYDENVFDIVAAKVDRDFQQIAGDPRLSLQEWYLKRLKDIDQERKIVRAMAKAMTRSLDAEEATLVYRHGFNFKQAVEQDITAKGKGKGMTYFHGRAGSRSVPQNLYIKDFPAAMAWAEANLSEAVTKELKISVIQAAFKPGGEQAGIMPDGCDMSEPRESFSPITDYRTLKMAQLIEEHYGIEAEAVEVQPDPSDQRGEMMTDNNFSSQTECPRPIKGVCPSCEKRDGKKPDGLCDLCAGRRS